MSRITVLAVGGTGESYPGDTRTDVSGMLAAVTDHLDDRFATRWIPYPASYGPVPKLDGVAFRHSVEAGVRALAAAVEDADGPIILLGYSQGCTVVRELLADTAITARDHVLGTGLVADPQMPHGLAVGKPHLAGSGVAGPGGDVAVPTWWIANDHDPICNASPDSLLRDLADLTEFMSGDGIRWGTAVMDRLRHRSRQNAWGASEPGNPAAVQRAKRRVDTAIQEARAYLPFHPRLNATGGQHTSYSTVPYNGDGETGCELLARKITEQFGD
ncbi:PE-PPE domain-containing protein [Nocardia sp. NPDC050712]|uniref:PE-PPE domain-containing protein n=1 Tax=Nocardia sp. NPDC050712 TaxID=3155518 RepID=UPI0033DAD625